MSKHLDELKTDAKQLEGILADLHAVPASADWDSLVGCSRTLATGKDVEYWYLAEFFLSIWVNWEGRVVRYPKYFGQPPTVIPASWRTLREQCREFADHFWSKDRLDELLAKSWKQPPTKDAKSEVIDPSGLYHEIIASHHRISICPPTNDLACWRRAAETATETDREVRAKFDRATSTVQRQVRWHLSQYRHSTFDVSWLDRDRWKKAPSAYEHAARSSAHDPTWLRESKSELTSRVAHKEEVMRGLQRIATAISEIGFYSFADDVTSGEMKYGHDSPVGTDIVQIIAPDSETSGESDFRLIVCKQASCTTGIDLLQKTLDRFNGQPSANFVTLITDSWDTPTFEQNLLPRVQQAHENGHRFLFLLVSSPETCISRIELALNVATPADEPDPFGRPARAIDLD